MSSQEKSREAQDSRVGETAQPPGHLRIGHSVTPTRGFVIVAAILLVAVPLITQSLIARFPALMPAEAIVESLLNIGAVLPLLMFLFVLPSARNLRERQAAEQALRAEREELAVRVRERTAELEDSNRRLCEEAEVRRGAQKAIQFQASLLDAVEQAVVALDGEGRVLYWNRFAEGLYGWEAAETHGRRLVDILTFVQPDGGRLDERKRCELGASWSGEVEAVRRDGARLPIHLAWSPLVGETQGCVCVSFDVIESKAAREALKDSEEKYSTLVENSPTGVLIFQDNRFCFVNRRYAEILEYSREELLRVDPWLLVPPELREWVAEIARKRAAGEPAPEEYECQLVTRSGQARWVAMRNTLIRYRGSPAILGNVQDITERKRMEAEVHQLSARLLRVQEEERRRLARDLHDSLGQKLTGIKFLMEASLGEPWPKEQRTGIARLRALIPVIQDAVEEVRRISTELRPSILDDLGLLPTLVWHLRELKKAHPGIVVEQRLTAVEPDVPDALRTPIYRILQEATNNVVKHSGTARMLVGLETGEGRLRLWIQDDGVGFEPGASAREAGRGGIGMGSMRERTEPPVGPSPCARPRVPGPPSRPNGRSTHRSACDQALLEREDRQRGGAVDVELAHQVGPVLLHRLLADAQDAADLAAAITLSDQLEDLALTGREGLEGGAQLRGGSAACVPLSSLPIEEGVHELRRHRRAQVPIPCQHAAHRKQQLGRAHVLQHIAVGAALDGLEHILLGAVDRHDEHPGAGRHPLDLPQGRQAVQSRHREV